MPLSYLTKALTIHRERNFIKHAFSQIRGAYPSTARRTSSETKKKATETKTMVAPAARLSQ